MPGHTGSDSVVFVPDANVIFTGDLFWDAHLPNLIDASTKPWMETLGTLAAKYPAATFAPGHGAATGAIIGGAATGNVRAASIGAAAGAAAGALTGKIIQENQAAQYGRGRS